MRRTLWGGAASLSLMVACTTILFAFRPHLSIATPALVLVVPAILAVSVGGFSVGVVAAVVGFLAYDWFFLPPYGTLTVSDPQEWVALGVYLVVVLVVARLVAVEQVARRLAAAREEGIRRLFVVSEHLIGEQTLDELLGLVVSTVHETFKTRWVALLLPEDGALRIAATAGEDLTEVERDAALGMSGRAEPLTLAGPSLGASRIALTAVQRPVGQLVVSDAVLAPLERRLLGAFANQAALAIERSRLRAQAVRAELLEEADRWRSALMGAVSHDLRTPLASIKASVSTLRGDVQRLSDADRTVLLETIDSESDQLTRLVANLLDVARIESGTLRLWREPHEVRDVLDAGVAAAASALGGHVVEVVVHDDEAVVEVDLVLIAQVLANLLTNAAQHSPEGSTIRLETSSAGDLVAVSVSDEGPGVPEEDRERLFHMVDRRAGSGRAGLGLAISTAFLEAHAQRLEVDDAPGGGARFTFQVPLADLGDPSA